MIQKFKIIGILLIVILLSSCSKKRAIGEENIIYVLSSEKVFDTYKNELEKLFSDTLFTPMPENRFEISHINIKDFKNKRYFKNLILITDVDSKDPQSEFINRMLPADIPEGIREGKYAYLSKNDLWALKQNVLFLMTSKEDHLSDFLKNRGKDMFNLFKERNLSFIKESLFDKHNNKKAEKYIKSKYGVEIFVPHDFFVVNEGVKTKFIRFRRKAPDRWLTIIWGDYDSSISYQENFIKIRDRAGLEFGDVVNINPEIISFEPDTTFVKNGFKTKGIWEYELGGGPFFGYSFLKGNEMIIIDGAVFRPGQDKYPFIDQLDLMAKSFKLK
ncbi:MAG: hypothetical protein CR982_00700 [Candidatus Cloacimonadota bacterium]|nr:MAG: hypothetical protein CR982_00700 [Candidatus Cloacimonadota bacterium]PIE79756.1 MAG: hypothetical protein CSA15_02605 [Candidatus Delongbacteria bacterium]